MIHKRFGHVLGVTKVLKKPQFNALEHKMNNFLKKTTFFL